MAIWFETEQVRKRLTKSAVPKLRCTASKPNDERCTRVARPWKRERAGRRQVEIEGRAEVLGAVPAGITRLSAVRTFWAPPGTSVLFLVVVGLGGYAAGVSWSGSVAGRPALDREGAGSSPASMSKL
jgi:hypothetical protein